MGERSQIYIRYNIEHRGKQYKGLIARYYSWNYGSRMISRARSIIEYIKNKYLEYTYHFTNQDGIEQLIRYCDINFDMKDIMMSTDIIKQVLDSPDPDDYEIFDQDNNDGQLYIDVVNDRIKYCFLKSCQDFNPMDGEEYMKWNQECDEYPNWHIPNQYTKRKEINYTEDNIAEIDSMAELMTEDEIEDFIGDNYNYLFAPMF